MYLGSTRVDPGHSDPPQDDMQSLIHSIAVSIVSIKTRHNDMDKRVASNTAAISITSSPLYATPIMATVSSGSALLVPTAGVLTYKRASVTLNGPQQATVVRNQVQ
ncbi:UNVERIFIED_CONTAM: hypothetical protein FKN15_052275 [Acipenser sinensis]